MEKIEFEVHAGKKGIKDYYVLLFDNYQCFYQGHKSDKIGRMLHIHDGDWFKITFQKIKHPAMVAYDKALRKAISGTKKVKY